MIKRAFDISCSLLALVLAWPILLFLMVLIRLEGGGSSIFRQKRVGRFCKPFEILKLRTMVADAENLGGYSTIAGDPRVTRVGKFLRMTSLDELPQLINVLQGEMSIVGPRPDTVVQEANYSKDQWELRHRVRPGITGLAQARLRSGATHDQRIALDLKYVQQASFMFDIRLIAETAMTLFKNRTI